MSAKYSDYGYYGRKTSEAPSDDTPTRQSSDTSEIEEKINIETLEELKTAFQRTTNGSLNLDEFKSLIREKLHVPSSKSGQIDSLFQKINWTSEDAITWDEFCTYMQLEYAEKEDSYMRSKKVSFHTPARSEPSPHREHVLRISDTSEGLFVACSKDGTVSFWSSNLDLKRTRSVITGENSTNLRQKWITDFTIMTQYNKFIVGTGDREIAFYELSSFEPYCQISGLETVPMRMDYSTHGDDECLIIYGDSQGCVNVLLICKAGECLRTWKKSPRNDGIANVSIETIANTGNCKFVRWKVHGDWVQNLKYYPSIDQIITCSNHSSTALVVGSTFGSTDVYQQLKDAEDNQSLNAKPIKYNYNYLQVRTRLDTDQNVFKIHKGVKCFDFSRVKNIIITGGMDRLLRVWNPYVTSKPTATLRGHNSPINYLRIVEEESRIYSISVDKSVKVWDIQDHNCLLSISPKGHKIRGDLQVCYYSPLTKALAISTDQMSLLTQRFKNSPRGEIPVSHNEPVQCAKFNSSFKQVISCSEGSVVKVWDFETGAFIFEFGDAHGGSAITCMTFDPSERRLLTGGRDGSVKIWNYNNGHCLRTLRKRDGENAELCDVAYLEMNKNRYVLAVGWDRKINLYPDDLDNSIHHVQNPLPSWPDDQIHGHKEDILAIASSSGCLATSSYDGEILIWNSASGHVSTRLVAPPSGNDVELETQSVQQTIFLHSRNERTSADLVSSGPHGMIHFWSTNTSQLFAKFRATNEPHAVVTCLATDTENTTLYSADSTGLLKVFDISEFCISEPNSGSPELLAQFQAHLEPISSLEFIENYNLLMTSSFDFTVRLWTGDGDYIGTFGQNQPWDVLNPETFQHTIEDDYSESESGSVSSDPNSNENESNNSSRNSTSEKSLNLGTTSVYVDDEAIAEQIRQKPFSGGNGKRLRHEKSKLEPRSIGLPKEYQFLKCYDLAATPAMAPPKLKTSKASRDLYK